MVTSPFVPTPGYTYLEPSEAQRREFASLEGKPLAQKAFLENLGKFMGWEAARAKQLEEWKQSIQTQYPTARYEVTFIGEKAQIRQKTLTQIISGLPPGQQQLLAKGIQDVLAFQRKRELEKKYRRLQPSQREMLDRELSAFGVGISVGRRGEGASFVAVEPTTPSVKSVPASEFGGYELTPYRELTPEKARTHQVVATEPRQYFSEYRERTRVKSAVELEGTDVPFYEAARRHLFEGGMERGITEYMYSISGREIPTEWKPTFASDLMKHPFTSLFGNVAVGVVKDAESTIGFVEAIAGRPSARSYISTLGGTAISEAVSVAQGKPYGIEAQRYAESLTPKPGEEILGELVGMYLSGRALGAIGSRVFSWVGRTRVGQTVKFSRAARTLTRATIKVKEVLPSFRGSRIDTFLAKHSSWYYRRTGGVAIQEVVIPPVPQRLSFATLQASQRASTLLISPRTSGVWIGKNFLEPTTKATKHLISRGGQLSIGYLRELSFKKSPIEIVAAQRSVLPIVTQTHVTRMGILPYMGGKHVFDLTKPSIPFIGLKFLPKLKPMVAQFPMLREMSRIVAVTVQKQKQRQRQALALPTLQRQVLTQERKVTLKQPTELDKSTPLLLPSIHPIQQQKIAPMLKPLQLHKIPVPLVHPLPTLKPTLIPPMGGFWGGRELPKPSRIGFGRWLKRTHDIKKPEDLMSDFLGRKRRK